MAPILSNLYHSHGAHGASERCVSIQNQGTCGALTSSEPPGEPKLNKMLLLIALMLLVIAAITVRGRSSHHRIPRATPWYPVLGNAIAFHRDAVGFLLSQREQHGDIVEVDLMVFKVIFFLGAEGCNAILRGTDKGGISFLAAMKVIIGPPLVRSKPPR